jgi:hypothetical protein
MNQFKSDPNSASGKVLRDIYRNSQERITLAMRLFVQAHKEGLWPSTADKEHPNLQNILNSIVSSQKFEENNDYKAAIQDVGSWILSAYHKRFFLEHERATFSPVAVTKKALEVLHTLLHRDLRRRQLSSTESQIYFEFQSFRRPLPDPRGKTLNQEEVDATLNELTRQSS